MTSFFLCNHMFFILLCFWQVHYYGPFSFFLGELPLVWGSSHTLSLRNGNLREGTATFKGLQAEGSRVTMLQLVETGDVALIALLWCFGNDPPYRPCPFVSWRWLGRVYPNRMMCVICSPLHVDHRDTSQFSKAWNLHNMGPCFMNSGN